MKTVILLVICALVLTGCRGSDVASPEMQSDLQLIRSHDQAAHAPQEVYDAAGRVFAATKFSGLSKADLKALLGPPLRDEEGAWFYSFHTGWIGHQRRFHFDTKGDIEQVEVVPTQ